MDLKVPQKILEQTKNCEKNFNCLANNTRNVCKVVHANGQNVLFIKKNPRSCFYKIPFGSSYICSCPTRHEIYKRYSI
jgi:hypothetical protein